MIIKGGAKGGTHSWQLVLADLALILFLVTLTALVNSDSMEEPLATGSPTAAPYVAPAQALFRPTARGPSLAQWLAEQPADPRTTLTIIARHSGADQDLMWQNAQMMAASIEGASVEGSSVEGSKVRIRVVITSGATSDLYASLAYDDLAYDDLAYESANEKRGPNVQTSQ